MSDFIANNLHKKVDHIMDIFFGAGVASHPTIIEQINYLLFMRALSQKDDDLRKIGVTDPDKIVFDGELEKYRWDNLLTLNAEQLFIALEECFRKIPESTTNRTARLVFRNAHIKLFDKPSLRTVIHELDAFAKQMDDEEHDGKRDIFGDTYEYLLSKLSQAGTSGQFRTPRHIIEFIVAVIAPKKGETILDPAVGTAGFLVKAFEYLRREYTSAEQLKSGGAFDKLSSKEHSFLYEHTFNGFDSDEDMIKFGMMNLYLHGLQNAHMVRQNSLTDTAGSRDKYDIILANPPFSGKIDRDSVAEELQMNTGSTEVLFLRYMMRHITENGRVGVIVPEGVLVNNASSSHIKIREMLLENGLWCVVSLPGGVFNPYAGVKTSILFFDKTRAKKQEVLFARVENDGYSLTSQRKSIDKNDLPEILKDIERYMNNEELQLPIAHVVSYDRIKDTKDYNLNGEHYKLVVDDENQKYPVVEIGEFIEFVRGVTYSKKDEITEGGHKVLRANNINNITNSLNLDDVKQISKEVKLKDTQKLMKNDIFICTASGSRDHIGKVAFIKKDMNYYFGGFMGVIRTKSELNSRYLFYLIKGKKFNNFLVARLAGANINNLKVDTLKSFTIPLPPIDIQKKIVEEIENKQKAIDHAHEIIKSLEREKQHFNPSSRAQKENWQVVTLEEVAIIEKGKSSSTKTLPGKYPLVLTAQTNKTSDHYDFDKDAVLVPLISSTGHGKADIKTIHWKMGKFAAANLLAVITPKPNTFDVRFLQMCLNAQKDKIAKTKMTGAANVSMKPSDLLDIRVPMPKLEIQKMIIDEFECENHISEANQKLIDIYQDKISRILEEI